MEQEPRNISRRDILATLPAGQVVSIDNPYGEVLVRFGGFEHRLETHLVLQVVDANGFTAIASTSFGVADVPPLPTDFAIVPVTASCGGENVQVQATIADPNPAEGNIQVAIDWDGPLGPDAPVPLDYQDNGDGRYTIINTPLHPATHLFAPGDYSFSPTLKIDGPDAKEAQLAFTELTVRLPVRREHAEQAAGTAYQRRGLGRAEAILEMRAAAAVGIRARRIVEDHEAAMSAGQRRAAG